MPKSKRLVSDNWLANAEPCFALYRWLLTAYVIDPGGLLDQVHVVQEDHDVDSLIQQKIVPGLWGVIFRELDDHRQQNLRRDEVDRGDGRDPRKSSQEPAGVRERLADTRRSQDRGEMVLTSSGRVHGCELGQGRPVGEERDRDQDDAVQQRHRAPRRDGDGQTGGDADPTVCEVERHDDDAQHRQGPFQVSELVDPDDAEVVFGIGGGVVHFLRVVDDLCFGHP